MSFLSFSVKSNGSRAPFGKLKPLPTGGKPVILWTDRDSAFFDIAQGIRKVIEELGERRQFHN